MLHAVVLRNLIKRTFALLLGNEDFGEKCEFLIKKLDLYIDDKSIRGLHSSLDHLKNGSVSLLKVTCCENLEGKTEGLFADEECELRKQTRSNNEVSKPGGTGNTEAQYPVRDKEKQSNDSKDNERSSFSRSHAGLQKELQLIKESDQFKKAVNHFKKANDSLAEIFKDNDKRQNNLFIKIIATKVRIISEILGNLTKLTDAAENCERHILKLHESFNAHRGMNLNSIMHINVEVFNFMKEFTGKPVAMLDWPMIGGQEPEKFHPILGGLPDEIAPPDPFTYITDASKNMVQIDSCIAAINCSGDIFAKAKASTDIVRITTNCDKWYSFDDDLGKNIDIVSIAIDCADCKTSTESQVGETSTQSNAASPSRSGIVCHGKMYIIARGIFEGNVRYFLYVIDVKGTKEREEELGFLERSATEIPKVKIFCINDKKVVVLDVTRRVIHICDNKGMEKHTIDATAYLTKINASRPPIFTYSGEIICLESKFNFFSKINVYDIVIDEGSSVEKTKGIPVMRAVQAVAFNHKSDKIIILCYNISLQYHLMTHAKEDGKLIEDIKLHNGKYRNAGLISNSHGPIALLDDYKLLRLK